MSVPALAARSGVSESTVKRILNGDRGAVAFGRVSAVARALGVDVRLETATDAVTLQETQAETKARRIIELVQGSSGLEAQAVGPSDREQMLRRTVHELMAGSRRRLWAQ